MKAETFSKFMLALRKFLIPYIRKNHLWTECETITTNEDCKNMYLHPFARAKDAMQCKLIDKQGRKWITDEVKIRKCLCHIPDIIYMSIIPYSSNDLTCNRIVSNSYNLKLRTELLMWNIQMQRTSVGYQNTHVQLALVQATPRYNRD